jgi:Zn-dependent protease
MMGNLHWLQQITIWALPVLFAITLHEAAHAYAAKRLGDSTAYSLGRMTLNPLKHIDPIGTLFIPLLCVVFKFGFVFGWAKPVPINFDALNNPKHDARWVAAAGPAANFCMALIWTVMLRIGDQLLVGASLQYPLLLMAQAGVTINVVFMILNLLPILPLDGGRIVASLLPITWARKFALLEPYGIFILIILLYTRVLDYIIQPFFAMVMHFLAWLL